MTFLRVEIELWAGEVLRVHAQARA
jgi:hypothetical protein